MYQKTRKLMTMHKMLHPRDDVDRLHVSRKRRKRISCIEDSVDPSIKRLDSYIQKRRGRLITVTRNNAENSKKNRTKITRCGCFKWLTRDFSHEKMLMCLRKGNLKREAESLQKAVQNNDIRTNHIKAMIHKTPKNARCRLVCDRE